MSATGEKSCGPKFIESIISEILSLNYQQLLNSIAIHKSLISYSLKVKSLLNDNEYLYFEIKLIPLIENDKLVYILAVVQNITEIALNLGDLRVKYCEASHHSLRKTNFLAQMSNPDPDPAATAATSHPSHILPMRLLFGRSFAISEPMATLTTPKLLIAGGPAATRPIRNRNQLQTLFKAAASPKIAVTLSSRDAEGPYQTALSRFLDQYLSIR